MSDKRKHRGANPQDCLLFGEGKVPALKQAAADYAELLTKKYPQNASLKLVGDKFELTDRQRLALMRSCCSKEQSENRKFKQLQTSELAGKDMLIDGYNVLITVEAAMSGAYVFIGRDGCFRDLAGLHGTYRKVTETIPAIAFINSCLTKLELSKITWLLDRPVSNSGRLKKIIELHTSSEVILTDNPDVDLKRTEKIIASSDSIILDSCKRWFNLAAYVITQENQPAKIIDLSK
ncbi:MAG: hypothetical protein A2Y12_00325 [Planctomycetes bacterium GWF2_42_9]|nr:MAG: hypothetical protein A2Y12_00325 [Planctomycetes bacterium GWF2_42_9]HAL44669.1 DUF434 domain-containing protein [Phycisphaerales bacterium]